MTILRLNGTTSGYTELSAPAAAGSNRLILPTGNGASGQALTTDGTGTTSWATIATSQLVQEAVTTLSGGSTTISGIPSWAKKIHVIINSLSLAAATDAFIQIGNTTGVVTSGYSSTAMNQAGTVTSSTAGFIITSGSLAADSVGGVYTLCLVNPASNVWIGSGNFRMSNTTMSSAAGQSNSMGNVLDRIRINANTSTFDNGNFNLIYEG